MKLLTHNLLSSHVRGVTRGFPLLLQASEVKINNVDYNQEFITRMIPKMEWNALVEAAESIGHGNDLPQELSPELQTNEDFLQKVHHVLLEIPHADHRWLRIKYSK
ncbi:multifunctional methyltransferase subunit TRM112-like protein isoform X2 [Narcine bancroftii]|uniref:multifunctional methyltransferase subunit TRM112-like protein isoform X2 n=1 Tax=Narcine bancroftii TaxID=1343680 RepID=UPI003831A3A4